MNKIYISFLTLLFLVANSYGQEAEDVIILHVKTNYKVFYEGERLFEENCSTCHGIKEESVSVALEDIHTKRSREWLLNFLQRPQTLEYSEDEETMAYKSEYGTINHQIIRGLKEDDYVQILDFLESEMNGPLYDTNKLKEEYYVLQKNELVKVGDYKRYFPDGSLSYSYKYNNGLPWEVLEVYDVFGEKKDGGTLKNGTGTLITYDKYGNKESKTTYNGGFRSGEYLLYFDGGQTELMGYYNNGKANGKWTYYYPNGKVKNYITYRNGRIISNSEADKPTYNPGIASQSSYNNQSKPTTYVAPATTSTNTVVTKNEVTIYPYNGIIDYDITQLSNKKYTSLGNDLFSKIILKKSEDIYSSATTNFRKFHPPSVLTAYIDELNSFGEFEFYRMDKIGFTSIKGKSLVLMEYYLSYPRTKIKLYASYILENGTYKLDGLSYERTKE